MALAAALACAALAQTPAGSILGTVTDASDAIVPGVTVAVTNVLTGVRHATKTNQEGEYLVPYLIPGDYQVAAEAGGFKSFQRGGLTLQVDQRLRIDVVLSVGDTKETIVVEARAPLLESEQSALGQVVNLQQVRDLPLQGLGRSPLSLVSLIPGVFNQSGAAFASIGGGRAAASSILLDGIGNHNTQPIHVPSVDAVQEFKVHTHAFSAEYGRTGGGIVSLSIKSGTNQVRGNVFEFFRNDVLNARNFFSLPNDRKPVVRYNEFGGTLGGPVRIPRLFDGRNRLFFFVSYQGVRQHTAGTFVNTVPTALQQRGIFTEGNQARIYDPATTRTDPANPSRMLRDLFAGNQLPASRIDASANRLVQLFPSPNAPGLVSNYVSSAVGIQTTDTSDNRIDYRVSNSDSVMFRYSFGLANTIPAKVLPGLADRTSGIWDKHDRNTTLQEVHTFSPRLINEFRIGLTNMSGIQNTVGYPGNLALEFGIPSFPSLGMPVVNITGTAGLGPATSRNLQNQAYQYIYLVDAVTYIRGKHILKIGTDTQFNRSRRFQPDVGTLNFDATFTNLPGVANTGLGMASFLLGLPTRGALTLSQIKLNFRSCNASFFVQDDWKVARRLTLNLGIRFDAKGLST